ncbi:MAG: DNA repair exonuclease [Reichenbachiella sp.]|uniref:metallophosphoesterase family protein n=1 Tax=Reichenbachiella sp. TaxID=2184521 RepID=UPI003265D472
MSAEATSILLFSDTHIGFDHAPNNKPGKNRRRGPDFFQNFKYVIDKAIELKVDYLIHCGDVFEKQSVPTFLVDQTYAEFLRIANAGIKLVIVPGNHERSVLPPSLFLNHDNIYIFDSPQTFSFPDLSVSGFPYYRGDIRSLFPSYKEEIESQLNPENFNLLCVHHAIDGVKAGFNFFEFRNRKDTLDINDLPGQFDLILSGHIHKHQILNTTNSKGDSVPIIYSGSTERTMFDEIEEVKGCHTFKVEGKKFKHQFHPITTRSMHRIDLKSKSIQVEQVADFLVEQIANFDRDSIVQLIAEEEAILYELSRLKTNGFFANTMNITISGFSVLHRFKQE